MARQPAQVRLKFKQSLKGAGIANAELLKRLKALHIELMDIDQDLIVQSSLDHVAKELMTHSLLLHKEKGVRAYLSCCLADILRLYAPEAPYTQSELKDLFQFLIRQMRNLSNSSDPHFPEYFYLIESLSTVKSVVLICDLDSADELMAEIFKQSFDIITSDSPKNVEISLADILTQLIEESQSITSEVIDIILAQFLPKNVKGKPAAHRLAIDVCTAAADRLQRYVCQYFAEVITNTIMKTHDSDDDEVVESEEGRKGKGKAKEELPTDFVIAHHLIRQINRSVPALLLAVVPQLEEELRAEKPEYRKLATEILGQMIGEKIGQGDLATNYPGTWKEFLGRGKDKVPAVRIAMVETLPKIWREHEELKKDIEATMERVLLDPDDRVRLAACKVFTEVDYETACHHISKSMLVVLSERCKDRKQSVRACAFVALGRIYDLAYPEIENRDETAIAQFAWIPGAILDSMVYGDPHMQLSIRAVVIATILDYILPLPEKGDDEVQWTDRMLVVMRHLNPSEVPKLLALTNLQDKRPGPYEALLNLCEMHNGGEKANIQGASVTTEEFESIKARLKMCIKSVAARMPDPPKAAEDLGKIAKANERPLYKALKTLMDPQCDLKTCVKNYKDALRRIENISPTLMDTATSFIRLSAYLLVGRSSVPTLLKRVQTSSGVEGELQAKCADSLLHFIANNKAIMYKSHIAELHRTLTNSSDEKSLVVALKALSCLAKVEKEGFSVEKKLVDRVKHFAKSGTAAQAKYAATIASIQTSDPTCADDLVNYLADKLSTASPKNLVSHLSALSRLARWAETSFENRSEKITKFVLETLLQGPSPGEIFEDDSELWVEDELLDDLTRSRVICVKILTNRCIAFDGTDSAEKVATPVFKLLWPLLQSQTDISPYSAHVGSRLRLAAANAVLKLASSTSFQGEVAKHFDILARSAQDSSYEVRHSFITRLLNYLRTDKIQSARFNMILFLVAHDPEEEIRQTVTSYVKSRVRRMPLAHRQAQFEYPFLRLLHLLAHHPDFSAAEEDVEEIQTMAKYIGMYLECLAMQDNLPYLYHLASKIKSVRDGATAEFDKKLYILSEVAQHLIKLIAKQEGWAIPSHPQSTKMPGDIFKVLPSAFVAREVRDRSYVSSQVLEKVSLVKQTAYHKIPKVKTEPRIKSPKLAKTQKRRSPQASRKLKNGRNHDSEDDSDPESDEEDDDDDDDDDERQQKRSRNGPGATLEQQMPTHGRATRAARPSLDDGAVVFAGKKAVKANSENEAAEAIDDISAKGKAVVTPKKTALKSSSNERGTEASVGTMGKKKSSPATRRALRGLSKPRVMERKENVDISDISDAEMVDA